MTEPKFRCFICDHPFEFDHASLKYINDQMKLCDAHKTEVEEDLKLPEQTFIPPVKEPDQSYYEPGSDG